MNSNSIKPEPNTLVYLYLSNNNYYTYHCLCMALWIRELKMCWLRQKRYNLIRRCFQIYQHSIVFLNFLSWFKNQAMTSFPKPVITKLAYLNKFKKPKYFQELVAKSIYLTFWQNHNFDISHELLSISQNKQAFSWIKNISGSRIYFEDDCHLL